MKKYIRDPETGIVYPCEESIQYLRDPETGLVYPAHHSLLKKTNPPQLLLTSILQEQLKTSTGCTELSVLTYGVALAYNTLNGSLPLRFQTRQSLTEKKVLPHQIDKITLTVDRKVYKNAFAARLPVGQNITGLEYACALGVFGNPRQELNIYKNLSSQDIKRAIRLVRAHKIEIRVTDKEVISPYIKVRVFAGKNISTVIIQHHHSNVTLIKLNNRIIYRSSEEMTDKPFSQAMEFLGSSSLRELIYLSDHLSATTSQYLREGLRINQLISRYGLTHYPRGITATLQNLIRRKTLGNDLVQMAQLETIAGVEARMSGAPLEVVTVSGSGNQGLITFLPINAIAHQTSLDEERLLKSLALSCLVTAYTTYHTGYLTPLCGCFIKSGLGATAGITYYLKGSEKQISSAVKNMAGIGAGVICDGAKVNCALKAASATATAVESALLGLNNVIPPAPTGIINTTFEQTIRNLGRLSQAMQPADKTIVNILSHKNWN